MAMNSIAHRTLTLKETQIPGWQYWLAFQAQHFYTVLEKTVVTAVSSYAARLAISSSYCVARMYNVLFMQPVKAPAACHDGC